MQFLLVTMPIRELSNTILTSNNSIRELCNWIRELCNCIFTSNNSIRELYNSILTSNNYN